MKFSDDWSEYVRAHCKAYKYSATFTDFWLHHTRCAIRGCGLRSAAPHHIRSRGAGGDDSALNLLPLCTTHHLEIESIGDVEFARRYFEVAGAIEAAMARPKVVTA